MRTLFAIAALFALAVPAAFAVPPTGQGTSPNASQLCKEQRRVMGPANFQSTYAPTGKGKNAFGKCVSRQSQVAETNAENAAKECKTERGTTQTTIDAFNAKYGTNKNKKNAFGKCVSSKAKETTEAQQDATLNAAKTCKAERGATQTTIDAFNAKYGTNKNKKNAFGKCVSKNAKEKAAASS
jgi:ABC-type microcin C transport system permease subunit YejB